MIKLYEWQKKALDSWEKESFSGIISATTGSGKTFVAISAIERLLDKDKNIKTVILVPTIALLDQWKKAVQENIKNISIGLLGSKYSDKLKDNNIMIYVANSALKHLKTQIDELTEGNEIFLIADECHRYGSANFSTLLKYKYNYNLGLSATPKRESDYGFEDYLTPYIGNIIYSYNYNDAIKDDVISPFEVINYGIKLAGKEKDEYRRISDKITDLRSSLEGKYPSILRKRDRYIAELRKFESKDKDVKRFLDLSVERKRILYRSPSRLSCIMDLIKENKDRKIMIFHEDVESLELLSKELEKNNYEFIMIHYKSNKKREEKFEQFKTKKKGILLSAKMFAEGVDLPDVDIGIIAAASSSVRQKIQTIGRIIRKSKQKEIAKIINIFIKDTSDERIFSKVNWENIIGKDRMKSFEWTTKKEIEIKSIVKEKFRSAEDEENRIDKKELKPKDIYTAKISGQKFSFNLSWKLFKKEFRKKTLAKDQEKLKDLADMVKAVKPEAGSFFINEKGHVLVRNKDYKTIYAGKFNKSLIKF